MSDVRMICRWTLVAKDGKMLGYLAESALAPMH